MSDIISQRGSKPKSSSLNFATGTMGKNVCVCMRFTYRLHIVVYRISRLQCTDASVVIYCLKSLPAVSLWNTDPLLKSRVRVAGLPRYVPVGKRSCFGVPVLPPAVCETLSNPKCKTFQCTRTRNAVRQSYASIVFFCFLMNASCLRASLWVAAGSLNFRPGQQREFLLHQLQLLRDSNAFSCD